MTRFYLVRHGEKASPPSLLVARSPGVPLTERGKRQADAIARRLQRESIDHVFASPMERAQQTAAPLAWQKGLAVEILEGIHEFHFGEWTNRSIESLAGLPGWASFNSFRSGTRAPGGELMLEIQGRFVGEMLRLRERFPEAGIALFSHGDPIRAAIMYFAGTPLDFWNRFEIGIGSISTVELNAESVRITRVNEVPELG